MTLTDLRIKFKNQEYTEPTWPVKSTLNPVYLKSIYGRWLEQRYNRIKKSTHVDTRLAYLSDTGIHGVKNPKYTHALYEVESYFIQEYMIWLENKILDI